jgi:rubrerythrin
MSTDRSQISRRDILRGAAVGAVAILGTGALAACSTPGTDTPPSAAPDNQGNQESDSPYQAEVLDPKTMPDAKTASNFNVVPDSQTTVGSTYDNLLSAIAGETGATTKYEAYSKAAKDAGFNQIARLFQCTADAEKIHIELEFALASKMDASTEKPEPPTVDPHETDLNLIAGANGEIYETSDMYPSFIKKAQEEGEQEAVQVFSRAKLAESYHAKWYLDAYNTIDTPSEETYYLCPVCGYIHKGENFVACPICLAAKSSFTAY